MNLIEHLERQREFALRTFGPGPRTEALCKHIRKELVEIENEPGDVNEWLDVIILASEGALRTGKTPQEIAAALAAKWGVVEARDWPDWRSVPEGEPIEHDRSNDAIVHRGQRLGA